jgi:hypothetical protein
VSSRSTPHTDLVRQLYAEQRDQIAAIEHGAVTGNPVSKAMMEMMPALQAKLRAIEALGRFVASKEIQDADQD